MAGAAPEASFLGRMRAKPWWPWVKRLVIWGFFALIAWLVIDQARTIDWTAVVGTMKKLPLTTLLAAGALAAGSFALYSTYDLLGRHLTGHPLRAPTVMGITFTSYVFNLNLGSIVGGVALRYRLYSRQGLDNETITKVVAFSMFTNWYGYLAVGGIAFTLWPLDLPPDWGIDGSGLQWVGAALLVLTVGYLMLCAMAKGRTWQVRGHAMQAPSLRMGLLQLVMSSANWSLMAGIIWTLLQGQVGYPQVLAVLLVAAIAGVITHVPAGLGVLEAVFVALLGHAVPQDQLIGALLAYRAIYYLVPLAIAATALLVTELRARQPEHAAPTNGKD